CRGRHKSNWNVKNNSPLLQKQEAIGLFVMTYQIGTFFYITGLRRTIQFIFRFLAGATKASFI
ncbi:hypothetical protein, partial [Sporosarcina sp. P35]|uniref:hypothetical protein n=1 Tax=Sporosarcina sp. P35 TaxID=2048246 RepID=UPI001E456D5C